MIECVRARYLRLLCPKVNAPKNGILFHRSAKQNAIFGRIHFWAQESQISRSHAFDHSWRALSEKRASQNGLHRMCTSLTTSPTSGPSSTLRLGIKTSSIRTVRCPSGNETSRSEERRVGK